MDSVPTLLGQLRREDSKMSWGFRLQGGHDYNSPLTVVNIVNGGIAFQIGMLVNDQIIEINGKPTTNMTHHQAQQIIVQAGNSLDLLVFRETSASAADYIPQANQIEDYQNTSQQPYIVTNDFNNDFTPLYQDAPSFSFSSGISLPQSPPRSWNPQSNWRPMIPDSTQSPPSPKTVSFQLENSSQNNPGSSQFLQNHGYAPIGKQKGFINKPANMDHAPTNTGVMSTRRAGPQDSIVFAESDSDFDPICWKCRAPVRGSYVQALGRNYCPEHFICTQCGRRLVNTGFVEESGALYCEDDFLHFMAPRCSKCSTAIVGPVVTAMDRKWHPHCFVCTHCRQPITSCSFRIGDDKFPYCERDWNDLFLTRCDKCNQAIEPSDRYIDAFQKSFHADCFCCSVCQIGLEGMPFFAKDGKPFCKNHAHSSSIY